MDKAKQWTAYGDVNPMEHGGSWIKEDEECKGSFYIKQWHPIEGQEGSGYIFTAYITPTDDWIEKDEVFSYADLNDDSPIERIVEGILDYYGAENCAGNEEHFTQEQAKAQLKIEGIEV